MEGWVNEMQQLVGIKDDIASCWLYLLLYVTYWAILVAVFKVSEGKNANWVFEPESRKA